MTRVTLPQQDTPAAPPREVKPHTVLLVGNPNSGKTTLFNKLTGLRAKTANYPGITVDIREADLWMRDESIKLIDLPGLYSLDALTPEERVAESALRGTLGGAEKPDAVVLVLDGTALERNLFLAGQVLEMDVPTIVVVNLLDAARHAGIKTDYQKLSQELNAPVVPLSAKTGEGLAQLEEAVAQLVAKDDAPAPAMKCTLGCNACPFVDRYGWAEGVADRTSHTPETHGRKTAAIDRVLTRPFIGVVAFFSVMLLVFYLIFVIADIPMGMIEEGFAFVAGTVATLLSGEWMAGVAGGAVAFAIAAVIMVGSLWLNDFKLTWKTVAATVIVAALAAVLPTDDFRSLLENGVIGGVGGVLVFLPQICILFFFIALLEDSGYLARAAFVMERLMRRVGLPGKAFVPMLSAHACAIPGIMAARVIEDWRDRLVTILVLPMLSCSARLPVYVMLAALLFSESPAFAAAMFFGAYVLGITAALLTALMLKKSILSGETVPLVIELPSYRRPSLRNAAMTMLDRAMIFVRKAGTVILLISVVLWAMSTYPKLEESDWSPALAQEVATLEQQAATLEGEPADAVNAEADSLVAQAELSYSFAGRIGRAAEPIFDPLGFDWKVNVGVISSFAAREVIVSTLAIVYGIGEDAAEETATLTETLRAQKHADGSPVFTTATCFALLVFYVLAMQCLPTQVVTRRETGSWKWAGLQLGYMTALAYVAALITYQSLAAFGL